MLKKGISLIGLKPKGKAAAGQANAHCDRFLPTFLLHLTIDAKRIV